MHRAVLSDDVAFMDSLPDEEALRAELGELLPERRCAVCQSVLSIGSRCDRLYCSNACKQYAYEQRWKARLAARRAADDPRR
jgi:hypothetical protein